MYRNNRYGNDNTRFQVKNDWQISQRDFPKVNLYSSYPWKKEALPSRGYVTTFSRTNKPSTWRHSDGSSLNTSFESDYSGTSSSYTRPLSSTSITRRVPSYDSFSYELTSRKPLTDFKVNGCMYCGRTFELMSRLFKHEAVCPFKTKLTTVVRTPYYYEHSLTVSENEMKHNLIVNHLFLQQPAQNATTLYPCNYCLRKFDEDALERHLPTCRRMTRRAEGWYYYWYLL
jgi:DNA-directed RNA polymerase subunit RPC12/RpoP